MKQACSCWFEKYVTKSHKGIFTSNLYKAESMTNIVAYRQCKKKKLYEIKPFCTPIISTTNFYLKNKAKQDFFLISR